MNGLEKYHDAHMFYRLEMQCRRELEKNVFLKWLNRCYEALADYGYGVGCALFWWAGHILAGGVLIWLAMPARNPLPHMNSLAEMFKGVVLSLANAHGFLGLHRGPLKRLYPEAETMSDNMFWLFNAIWVGQILIGTVLLFLVLLTIRTGFRMR